MLKREDNLYEGSLSMVVKINAPSKEEAIRKLRQFSNVADEYVTSDLDIIATDICEIEQVNNYRLDRRLLDAS